MKILLLGGEGYIGSALYERLAPNHEVKSVDFKAIRYSQLPLVVEPGVDFDSLSKEEIQRYDIVILLAGQSAISTCTDYLKTFDQNVNKFVKLVDKLRFQQLLIYASSGVVYGNTRIMGQYLTMEVNEIEPFSDSFDYYGLSKQTIDNYARISGKNVVGLRFGSLSGYSPRMIIDLFINKMVFSAKKYGKIVEANADSSRAVLDMKDLLRAFEAIIHHEYLELHHNLGNGLYILGPIVYNLRSFNSKIMEATGAVATKHQVPIETKEDGNQYSFAMSAEKFELDFKFKFEGTINSIIDDLDRADWDTICANPENFVRI